MLLPNSTGMVETYFFFSLGRLCVCTVFGFFFVNGDMGHDRPDLTGVCLARFTASSLFFFIHFSAYTEKDQGGWAWVGLGWVVGSSQFLFFLERMYGSLRFRVV